MPLLLQAFFPSFLHGEGYPVKTLFMFRGCAPCDHMERGSLHGLTQRRLSAVPPVDCLGLDKSFNIRTCHLLISKLGFLPPSSQCFCDY